MPSNKHDILNQHDIEQYTIPAYLIRQLNECALYFKIAPHRLRILDWGCGRGALVAKLLSLGFDAFGAEIDQRTIMNGRALFQALGHDHAHRISLLEPARGRTQFGDGYFHMVLSQQVFEHLECLGSVAGELARLTVNDGLGLHKFPAKWRMVEPHLFLPFIHWLPKNRLRYLYVWLCLAKIPPWPDIKSSARGDRAAYYYRYSIEKTFYRNLSVIQKTMQRHGFSVSFHREDARGKGGADRGAPARPLPSPARSFRLWHANTFQSVEMLTRRLAPR